MKKLFVFVATLMLGATMSFAQAGAQTPDAGKSEPTTSKTKKHHHKGGKKAKKNKKGSADSTTPPAK